MARARNIKPGFFKNEDLAECSPWARLCFAGLWILADRSGRLQDRPRKIKGELFAFDSIEVEPLLVELHRRGFIDRYVADNVAVIQVVTFEKHQNPHHREVDSVLPTNESPGLFDDASQVVPRAEQRSEPGKAQGLPGIETQRSDLARGSSRAESSNLIPDSGSLIPDPGILATAPTAAATACMAMKRAGLSSVNPAHPKLVALLGAGITLDELVDAARDAVEREKGFPYALATAEGRRRDSKTAPLPPRTNSADQRAATTAAAKALLGFGGQETVDG
jgi:hypothetical protein